MYQYTITADTPMTIDTSFCKNLSDVKQDIITQSADCIHRKSTYPNGFAVEMIQSADKIVLKTNRELIDNGDGRFTVSDK